MARNLVPISIAVSTTDSSIAQGSGLTPAGLYMPPSFTGTTITFRAYTPDGKIVGLVIGSDGNAYSRTVSGGKYVPLDPTVFAGVDGLQVISGSSEAAARSLQVVFN